MDALILNLDIKFHDLASRKEDPDMVEDALVVALIRDDYREQNRVLSELQVI